MSHGFQDSSSSEIASRLAGRLREPPALLGVAHHNLARWSRLHADAPSLLRGDAEWSSILAFHE